MASAELSRRVEKLVGCPPLCEMGGDQRREFYEALLDRRPGGSVLRSVQIYGRGGNSVKRTRF